MPGCKISGQARGAKHARQRPAAKLKHCYCKSLNSEVNDMLQCRRCRLWFHYSCIQCMEKPPLFGDRFFIFTCANCNFGSEYLARIEIKWVEIAHLVLYHLYVLRQERYFDVDQTIMPFLLSNRVDLVLLGRVATCTANDLKNHLFHAFCTNPKIFKNEKNSETSTTLWGLRKTVMPEPPFKSNPLPSTASDVEALGRKCKVLRQNRKCLKDVEFVTVVASTAKMMSNNQSEVSSNPSRTQSAITLDSDKKVPGVKRRKRSRTSANLDLSPNRLLESLIPVPPNFENLYNLFLDKHTEKKRNGVKKPLEASNVKKRRALRRVTKVTTKDSLTENKSKVLDLKQYFYNNFRFFDNHKSCAQGTKNNSKTSSHYPTRSLLKHLEISETDMLSIIGRRVTPMGKVQYLIQWNR